MKAEELKDRMSKAKDFVEMMRIFEEANGNIEDIPILDLQPVIHAHWENDGGIWKCSACRRDVIIDDWESACLTDYCPYCGARMDGEDE